MDTLIAFLNHLAEFFQTPLTSPILILSLLLFIILLVPIVFGKLNIPGVIGLILAGVIIGPYGFGILENSSSIDLFSTIGLLYIMFIAGLELDMNQFRIVKNRSLVFGLLTFSLPLAIGFPVCYYVLKLDFLASLLTASMFASQTLVAYPIVSKFGITKNQAVAITVGGTILTDTLVLIMLAIIINAKDGALDVAFLAKIIISLAIFSAILFGVIPRITKWFFGKLESEKSSHFIFVLAVLFFSAFLAEICGLESIIGAFIAGLVLNRLIPHSSALMNRIEFIGNTLFIPFFLISVGMLLDLSVLLEGYRPLLIAITLSLAAFFGKWLAAFVTQHIYRYTKYQRVLIFGLSSSHAAATLAIILSGYKAEILDENILNGTIILILITCLVGSFVTEKAARKIVLHEKNEDTIPEVALPSGNILIPIANFSNIPPLLDFAILLKEAKSKHAITLLTVVPDNEQASINIIKAKNKLESLVQQGSSAEVNVQVTATIDQNTFGGISRTARETMTDLIIMGWSYKHNGVFDKLLGNPLVQFINNTDKNIFICSLDKPMIGIRRIFLFTTPHADLEFGFEQWLIRVMRLSKEWASHIEHYGSQTTATAMEQILQQDPNPTIIRSTKYDDWEAVSHISKKIKENDLVIFVMSRPGFPSYSKRFEQFTDKLPKQLKGNNMISIYPHQPPHYSNMI